MKEIKVFLIPQPGAKPEFLASLQTVDPSPAVTAVWNDTLPDQIVLEGYTRDGWAWKPASAWLSVACVSTDGRNKLKGFKGYLKERAKSAYGRLPSGLVWVVSYIQPKSSGSDPNRVECRIALDRSKIPGCTLQASTTTTAAAAPKQSAPVSIKPAAPSRRVGGSGLLGKLVGAQQRTNEHVAVSKAPNKRPAVTAAAASQSNAASTTPSASPSSTMVNSDPSAAAAEKTIQQVFADFRQSMQDKMLDFNLAANDDKLEVRVSLAQQQMGLPHAEKSSVKMDVLKYMVYEAAEEVNEEWIAFKEPSEFVDEVVFVIYKEGAAPPEVVEEMSKGELPDEVRGQQRAIQEDRQRAAAAHEQRHKSQMESQAMSMMRAEDDDEEDDLEALNTVKRDRRTIADYEREKRDKKRRIE
jgi:hypothetical protein